jgi:hypothetical protein
MSKITLTRNRELLCGKYPSLERPRCDILLFLCWNSKWPNVNPALVEWVSSNNGRALYEQAVKEIYDPQSKEQLLLALAALLSYQRLLPSIPDSTESASRSCLANFDAVLKSGPLNSVAAVFEHMVLSIRRIVPILSGGEEPGEFLFVLFDQQLPVQDSLFKVCHDSD